MQQTSSNIAGIDVGGSMIKIGVVNVSGELESFNTIKTPPNSDPRNVIADIKKYLPSNITHAGFGIPCIVKNGITKTAPNIGTKWYNIDFNGMAQSLLGVSCKTLNDADAAAIAEIRFGEISSLPGVTIFLTFGTGIGTAIFYNGILIPNTEFGRMSLPGGIDNAETIASARSKADQNMTWEQYAENVNRYLNEINRLYWPDNVVIGGGVSDSWHEWGHLLKAPFNIYKAKLGNSAGMIGAAMYAFFD
jgi:polyphosphate glucokinase